jgi:hypothetical protein
MVRVLPACLPAPATASPSPRRPKAEAKFKAIQRQRERHTRTRTHTNTCTCNLQPAPASLLPQQPSPAQAQPYPAYLLALRRPSRKHTPPLRFPRPHPYPHPYRIHIASVADAADSIRVRQTKHLRPTSSASQTIYLYLGALRACSPGTTVRAGSPRPGWLRCASIAVCRYMQLKGRVSQRQSQRQSLVGRVAM